MQYATEKPDAPYDMRIYAGASGRFTLYEDDNETYAYEKGQSAHFDLDWDDAKRTLTISQRRGSFPAMTKQRQLKITVIGQEKSLVAALPPVEREVVYNGNSQEVRFNAP